MSPQQHNNSHPNGRLDEERRSELITAPKTATRTICLVDDDPSVLKATARLLSSAGWKVESFVDPIEFLEHARINQPGVVVLDILMPKMNGLEVQTRLRIISPATRVIILTSKDDPSIRVEAIDNGATAFFLKPVDDDKFLDSIESTCCGQ